VTLLDGDRKPRPLISRGPGDRYESTLDEYFLASRSLKRSFIVNLLLSAAFGVNAILFAAWLGYLMGLWAFAIQIAWSLSYILLARYVRSVSGATSLHDFLGQRFGRATRRVAAVCSIIGLTYFVGWEVSIARVTLAGFASTGSTTSFQWLVVRASVFIGIAAAIAILYSSLFGRRADAHANRVLNVLKSTLLIGIVAVLAVAAALSSHSSLGHELLPPLNKAVTAVGAVGLLTSLLFNLAWQFVDNSSWQSFNSGKAADPQTMTKDLGRTALWAFITVNGLGTLAGALMRGVNDVTSNNILVRMSAVVPRFGGVLAVAICILVFASMISLIDVIILAITQALVVDVGVFGRKISVVRKMHARVVVLAVGALAAWGVQAWVNWLGGSIFNFVYIVVIAQLSLSGPVLVGLIKGSRSHSFMWLIILCSGLVGVVSSVIGSALSISVLVDGAGALTVAISIIGAAVTSVIANRNDQHLGDVGEFAGR
jgi:hypothetical protein